MKRSTLIKGSFLLYLLIGLEILIMISPFAAYFYSLYSPLLRFIHSSSSTRWLAEFFLPHFVFTDDPFLRLIGIIQFLTFFSGMFIFFYAAVPLYIAKFRKKGIVTRGIYCIIRHPQYLGLGIAGFGLLLYWPRVIILIMYISMLFVYNLLAGNEEQRMLKSDPKAYQGYMDAVPMFVPGDIGGLIFRKLFGWMRSRGIAIGILYIASLAIATGAALAIREHSVSAVSLEKFEGISAISALPAPSEKISSDLMLGFRDPEASKLIREKEPVLAYVLPSDFFLMAIVTDLERLYPPDFEDPAPGNAVARFFRIFVNYTKMQLGFYPEQHPLKRIIFVRVMDDQGHALKGQDVFKLGAVRYPVFHIDIDEESRKVLSVKELEPENKWGDVPMPMF